MEKLHNHLNHLYLFQNVVKLGSFQAAATKFVLPRSSISKKIQQLENQIGQRLIHRSTRKLTLTETGKELLAASLKIADVLDASEKVIDDSESKPTGKVKISSSSIIGHNFILPLIENLRKKFPKIDLELCFSDDYVDLIEQEVDIAVRIGHLPDSSLIARKIGEKQWGWYASPHYLHEFSEPTSPEELKNHQCLIFKNQQTCLDNWPFLYPDGSVRKIKVDGGIFTDDSQALVEMSVMGLGIIMADPILLKNQLENGSLVPILEDLKHPDNLPINLVSLGQNYRSRATTSIWQSLLLELDRKFEHSE